MSSGEARNGIPAAGLSSKGSVLRRGSKSCLACDSTLRCKQRVDRKAFPVGLFNSAQGSAFASARLATIAEG